MKLSFRPAIPQDFASFYHGCYAYDRSNPELRQLVETEWHYFLANPTTISMIVLDSDRDPRDPVVGFAQTVFVTDAFVEYVTRCAVPHANQHASRPLPDGSRPLLTMDQLREFNSRQGLNALTTRWAWREDGLDDKDQWRVRGYIDRNYPLFYRGYNYKQVLIQAYGEWARDGLVRAGYSLLADYSTYYQCNPHVPLPRMRPYLLGITRKQALDEQGTLASHVFNYIAPRFFFKPHEQELLWLNLLGFSDEEATEKLCISLDAVKKRWIAIYERVQEKDVDLLPVGRDGVRGTEKRKRLMQYISEHLAELRPIRQTSDDSGL